MQQVLQMVQGISDIRQRFFVANSPVRGDIVQLSTAYQTVIAKKDYPEAIKALLGEMMVAASLLIGTLKIEGRLSVQLQADGDTLLDWAMAECDHLGKVRALAKFKHEHHGATWVDKKTANQAFAELGAVGKGVVFISIHPNFGDSYQGIVERVSDSFAQCLVHYQKQSAQIPTHIQIVTSDSVAAGILLQALPQSEQDKDDDPDLWERVCLLAQTLKTNELSDLPPNEILYRLYHEEEVVLPESTPLSFGCTCSQEKSETAILQLGKHEALAVAAEGELVLDCGFCGTVYRFDRTQVERLFV